MAYIKDLSELSYVQG